LHPAAVFGQAASGAPIKTTLCEIVKNPNLFDGKIVTLRTYIASGPDVPPGLYDRRCPPNNLLRIDEHLRGPVEASSGYRELQKNLRPETPIEATVTGMFIHKNVRPDINTFASTFLLQAISNVVPKSRQEMFGSGRSVNEKSK
jgi:hypothetical protein